ncbi:hypothetical protein ABZ807_11385 [Micromonospora sp. NPDC047548]|uniref:hypothetical protein n=1 Tax=Micromonospora sp. NPDC047548 TaxID=3155624 RepID=UPI0033CCE697
MTSGPDSSGLAGDELDGFRIGYLPPGIGELVSDFVTEWEGVRFTTRVWERPVDEGYRVDVRVHVLRGGRLTTLANLRDFLVEYDERPADWALIAFRHGAAEGFSDGTEAFWLVEPGVAVDLRVDPERFDTGTPLTIAESIITLG